MYTHTYIHIYIATPLAFTQGGFLFKRENIHIRIDLVPPLFKS